MKSRLSSTWRPLPRRGQYSNRYLIRPTQRLISPGKLLSSSLLSNHHIPLVPGLSACSWLSTASTHTAAAHDLPPPSSNVQRLLQPAIQHINKRAEWIKLIEPYLPVELRAHSAPGTTLDINADIQISDLADIIQRAGHRNIDVVAFLGLNEGRWEAVQWIVKELLQHIGSPRSPTGLEDVTSNLTWPLDMRGTWPVAMKLDDITQGSIMPEEVDEAKSQLDQSVDSLVDTIMSPPTYMGHAILGEIWTMLGNMIIAAAGQEENGVTMSNVLRIIASLHHHGWIPEAVYRYNPNADPSALQQPPLLYDLSSTMLSSLSEAVYLGDPAARSAVPAKSYISSRLFTRTANKIPDLGPELWLEFCLWCCVHGGWTKQGAKILLAIRAERRPTMMWSLICWRDILESPEEKWEEYAQRRLQASQGVDSVKGVRGRRVVVERTLSAEVVVAVIDGLISGMLNADEASTPIDATGTIEKLKGLLDRDQMSLGVSSWDSVIQRIANSSNLNIESNPRTMEIILGFAETFGHEIDSANAPGRNGINTSDKFASYVFDASATVLGIYHRTLHAYIKGRNASGALRVLGRLQTLTDANKLRSMEEFFGELQAVPDDAKVETVSSDGDRFFLQSVFPGVQYPGYFPNIPINILADLLDLLTEVGNTDVARWLLYSEDVDGPLIPESEYNNQLIAPALVRYAAANADSALLQKVTKAQSTDISGPTLVAICQSRIRQGDFSGAVEVLDLIQQYTLHGWRVDESASLIRALLPLVFGEAGSEVKPSPDARAKASQLMRQLLRGEHGIYWGKSVSKLRRTESQVDTVLALLSDISPEVADVCAGLLSADNYLRVDMSTRTFNALLAGIVQSFGARVAQRLVEEWCRSTEESHTITLSNVTASEEEEPGMRLSPAERFGTDTQKEPEAGVVVFKGSIRHDVDSIRAIISVALESNNNNTVENLSETTTTTTSETTEEITEAEPNQPVLSTEHDDLMSWAIEVLRADFNMTSSDIDYVTQGYFSSRNTAASSSSTITNREQPYSATTLRLWQAFDGTRRRWAQAQERRLRAFATRTADRHILFSKMAAAERQLIQSLAKDYGLLGQTFGEGNVRDVKVTKPNEREGSVRVPTRLIDELLRMTAGRTGWRLDGELDESSL